eukprot:scaffold3551_cov408-Prasinococcus_capsulatus_cf.AAC.3
MLQSFIDARYRSGELAGQALTDDQICGLLIAALFAGQHTSSITSTWTTLRVLDNKATWWPRLVEEQKAIMREYGTEINYESLSKMTELYKCIKEALRLHPPLIMLLRYVQVPFNVTTAEGKSYTIPKGHIVATSPTYNHRREEVFSDPLKYDPDRFAPGREEDKKAAFSFVGFGGGRHGCMGETFAFLQIKTLMAYMLRNFDLEPVGSLPEVDYEAMVVGPKGDCPVTFKRRKVTV